MFIYRERYREIERERQIICLGGTARLDVAVEGHGSEAAPRPLADAAVHGSGVLRVIVIIIIISLYHVHCYN